MPRNSLLQVPDDCRELEPCDMAVDELLVMLNKKVEVKAESSLSVGLEVGEASQTKSEPSHTYSSLKLAPQGADSR